MNMDENVMALYENLLHKEPKNRDYSTTSPDLI